MKPIEVEMKPTGVTDPDAGVKMNETTCVLLIIDVVIREFILISKDKK